MRYTYLKPTWHLAKTSKTYHAPDRDSKASDYNLGEWFTYDHQEYQNLQAFAADLVSRSNEFLIYGVPLPTLDLIGTELQRRTINFPYPEDGTGHVFDLDGYPVSELLRELYGSDIRDPDAVTSIVNAVLTQEGFDILADASKVIVLTSSSWDLMELFCHIYVDFTDPIRVEAMRDFTTAHAKVHQRKLFDPAMYKAVQPHFFTAPTCQGFNDPIHTRIWYAKGVNEQVSTPGFQELINTTMKLADWNPQSSATQLPPIGDNWLQTIRLHVGDERGVNEPTHRAAAQMVQQHGKQYVVQNINMLAQQMYDEVWNTLTTKDCEKGKSAKDKNTYTTARFRQYLQSATQKTFGDEVDKLVAQVSNAIDAATEGSLEQFTSDTTLAAIARLRGAHFKQYLPLKDRIKTEKIMTISDLNTLLKSAASDPDIDSVVNVDGTNVAESQLVETVLKQYDLVQDYSGNKFLSKPGNGYGGYHMIRIDGALKDMFFYEGNVLSGGGVGLKFGDRARSTLFGRESAAQKSIYKTEMIGTRVLTEDKDMTAPTWLNLGEQDDGTHQCLKIEPGLVTMVPYNDAAPRWHRDIPTLRVASNKEIEGRFGSSADLTPYLMETLPRFVPTVEHGTVSAIMWLVATIANKSHSYIAELIGYTGKGKSTSADFMKALIDPSGIPLGRGGDRTMFDGFNDDTLADLERRHITIFDQISKLSKASQDKLCSVATGTRLNKRILYSDSYMDREVRRPLILTSLESVINQDDLRGRMVTVEIEQCPYNLQYLEDFAYEQPFLTAALVKLTAQTLKLHVETPEKPTDIGHRDIFVSCVKSALDGLDHTEFDFVRTVRHHEATEAIYDRGFIRLLLAYIDSGPDIVNINTRGLHDKMKEWVVMNAGKRFGNYSVSMNDLPHTGRGTAIVMSKAVTPINRATDWHVEQTSKLAKGRIYTFTKRLTNLSDLLE